MYTRKTLEELAASHGTPLFIVDHDQLRKNYATFKRHLPRVQVYYAVKANPDPAIIKTLFEAGSAFDVASMPEFNLVYDLIKDMPAKARQQWIWDNIIYANTIKIPAALKALDRYKALVTYDNLEEIGKIKTYAPNSGLVLRLAVPNTGAVCELSSKCGAAPGEAVDLMLAAEKSGLAVEGISFHVGSQTTNFENYVQALSLCAGIYKEARDRGYTKMNLVDIGGGFPAPYDDTVKPFRELAKVVNSELDRHFPKDVQILAEPGRFLVATAGYSVSKVIGKAMRDGKPSYYINDGVYHTYSGVIFDHCKYPIKAFKKGATKISAVYGPTCDALDVVSMAENLPELERDDFVYSVN
ncbi:MAG TPA: type III PLP-dependent enzyme, partial [Verrucomicrobia bacterium]|nr:type III PLP-dependent enzyme [Verrucomicrobiota bacterium]